jgi:hypothetical protein
MECRAHEDRIHNREKGVEGFSGTLALISAFSPGRRGKVVRPLKPTGACLSPFGLDI